VDDTLGLQEQLHQLTEKIDEIRPSLNERESFLLEARLLSDEPLTLQEIGEKYGITREAVRQMEARLLEKIRKIMIPNE
jgi:RNA polymerase sigma-32 factor